MQRENEPPETAAPIAVPAMLLAGTGGVALGFLATALTADWQASATVALMLIAVGAFGGAARAYLGGRRRWREIIAAEYGRARDLERRLAITEGEVRRKSEFIATLGHEFRTPVTGILGIADVLLKERLDNRQRDLVHTLRESGRAVLQVAGDVLDLARTEAGHAELDESTFDLVRLVEGTAELMAPRAAEHGIEIGVAPTRDVPCRVVGDPGRLRQILFNLLGNALKFTRVGSATVEIRVERWHDGGIDIRLDVVDTGIGIPDEHQTDLFRRFSQVGEAGPGNGIGLGLSIVRELASLMGGHCGVESVPDQGSRFWVTLPLGVTEAITPPVFDPPVRALVMDPDDAHRRCVVRQLARGGAEIVAEAPEVRLDALRSSDANVALINLRDPTAAEQAGADELAGMARIGLVAVSAAPELRALAAARCDAVVDKPVTSRRLSGAIAAARTAHTLASEGEPGMSGETKVDAGSRSAASELSRPPDETFDRGLREAAEAATDADVDRGAVSGLDVLVVEDNRVNQMLAAALLERFGHACTIADGGRAALETLDHRLFDVILMDIQMPGMDGIATTRAIRARGGRFADIPILAMTAKVMSGDRDICLEAGMNDYISKPVDAEFLRQRLDYWGRPHEGRQAGGEGTDTGSARPPATDRETGDDTGLAALVDDIAMVGTRR